MKYQVRLSDRATKDLDRVDRATRRRMLDRLEQLSAAPLDARLSRPLTNAGELRRSRVGGWRIIFSVNQTATVLEVVTIERRGQVYARI